MSTESYATGNEGRSRSHTPAGKQALSVVAKLNAQLRAHRLVAASLVNDDGTMKKTNPDSTEFHAVIPINDYPQKARWKVTNKETMVQVSGWVERRLALVLMRAGLAHRHDGGVGHEQR